MQSVVHRSWAKFLFRISECNLYKEETQFNGRSPIRFNDNKFIGKRISTFLLAISWEKNAAPFFKSWLSQKLQVGYGYKILAKANKSVLWESGGQMEFSIKNSVCLVLFVDCILHILYVRCVVCVCVIYTYPHTCLYWDLLLNVYQHTTAFENKRRC